MPTLPESRPRFTLGEEIAHSVSHGIGILLSLAGLAVLVDVARLRGTTRDVVGCAVFGVSLVLLYTASTLYHSILLPRARPLLQVLDHAGIYLLIAGTYTPLTLTKLPAPVGWTLLGALWCTAAIGIVLDAFLRQRFRAASIVLYVLMGWSVLLVYPHLRLTLAPGGFRLLLAGGLFYTFGLVFYAMKGVRYHHLAWHLCVLAGSILQFFAILRFVVPPP